VDSSNCSTSPRGSSTSTPADPSPMAVRAVAADRTADRNVYSASPKSMWSITGVPRSEYTVHDSAHNSGITSSSSDSS